MSEKHGELIHLIWDAWKPPFMPIRGHVTLDEAREIVLGWDDTFQVTGIEHTYARKVYDFTGEYQWRYHEAAQGRGAFAVTHVMLEGS